MPNSRPTRERAAALQALLERADAYGETAFEGEVSVISEREDHFLGDLRE